MRPIHRLLPILLAASALPLAGSAFVDVAFVDAAWAQGPVPGTMQQPGPGTSPPAAGQVPSLSDQPGSLAPGQSSGGEPARSPGSKADQGTVLPGTDNSGTTTVYAPTSEADMNVKWPCVQPKVASIGAGTIWSGPDLAQGKDWEDDNATAELAQQLASRRTTLDEANDLIAAFAKTAGQDKSKKLTELFVGTLDLINGNRNDILEGIMRYARGQERLAERMREESDKISEGQENATATGLGVAKDQTNTDFAWDQRIFKERNQALSYVCETPSILERRAFEIGKRIQARI